MLLATLVALGLGGCGSGGRSSRTQPAVSPATAAMQRTVTIVQARFPGSLDPQAGDPAAAQATWVTYTGLVSYAHRPGAAGTTLIPGLATALPRISRGGRLYTVTLRRGLVYSDGRPVRAGDFAASLQRAVRQWGGAATYLDRTVVGAAAYAAGRARAISGISADDRTGHIAIRLTAADGAFDNVLAEPALGLTPAAGRPPAGRSPAGHAHDPPPGCGPYVIEKVVPGRSYSLVRNPRWRALPGIPAGRLGIDVKISGDAAADAEAVLNNTADVLGDRSPIPGRLAAQIADQAHGRFQLPDAGTATDLIFLNQAERPFDSELARQAVVAALDRATLDRLGAGMIGPGCELLAPVIAGHGGVRCPDAGPRAAQLGHARELVRRSGTAGEPVTVWTPRRSPAQAWMADYARTLDAIGFHATVSVVAAGAYRATVGTRSLAPQTGFQRLAGGLPDPIAMIRPALSGRAIRADGNENLGEVDDPRLNAQIERLSAAASPDAAQWQRIDAYVARRADVAVIGYERPPVLASARIDDRALVLSPVFGVDLTSLRLN